MAEKKNTASAADLGLGEISTIRNILMGQQMNEYEQRFGHLEEKLVNASDEQGEKLQSFQEETRKNLASIEKDMNARFDTLEKMLREGLDKLAGQTEEKRLNDKEALGSMLADMGQKLMK